MKTRASAGVAAAVALAVLAAGVGRVCSASAPWESWIANMGHDTFLYPDWITAQANLCACEKGICRENGIRVDPASATELTYCVAKQWLLSHMPSFDRHFLPPSVTVRGASMFEDNIVFALMADNATQWSQRLSLPQKLAYLLPYATYHEARVNWRPLFFSKFFHLVADANSTVQAMARLIAPTQFLNWTANPVPSTITPSGASSYILQWLSDTTPPVLSPFDFLAYGYGSCSGWATFITYQARALGIPARQAGTPCWNSGQFTGLATSNPNVTQCWHGGNKTSVGDVFLNNHNWVEYWDDVGEQWVWANVPPDSSAPNAGLCNFNITTGCNYDPQTGCANADGPGAAMQDHEIFSVTWSMPGELPESVTGGPVIDAKDLRLSSGEQVSPLVWSPYLSSPDGEPLKDTGIRLVNRTDWYRCKDPKKEPRDDMPVLV